MKPRRIIPAALVLLLEASALSAQGWPQTWASVCTLDVVLVTFQDATDYLQIVDPVTGVSYTAQYAYHLYDRPYGTNPEQSADATYTLEDFQRLLSGGYDEEGNYDEDTAFVGTSQTVGTDHTLPEVFGSVRAYFDAVSSGAFELHVRMINPADDQDYPRWVELPETKGDYAEIDHNDPDVIDGQLQGDLFWDDAYAAAWDSVRCWNPDPIPDAPDPATCGDSVSGYAIADIPNNSYDRERRLRHKVLYLYSGAVYSEMRYRINNRIRRAANPNARDQPGLIHPQVDWITWPNAPSAARVGYRYVMGERQGWGDDRDNHSLDESAGIGMHVHEIGHLLGFHHPDGTWVGTNPYTSQTTGDVVGTPPNTVTVRFSQANLSGWGSMQSGAHGPPKVGDGGYTEAYRSCPNPFNPFFRMDLGWNTQHDIIATRLDQRIEPGPDHFYVVEGENYYDYLLEFRTVGEAFGQYVGWYRFTQSPGLLVWRRLRNSGNFWRTMLIPADGRSIFDARARPGRAEPTEEDPTYTYVWQDRLSDPFGAVEQDGPFGPLPDSEHRPSVADATDATHLRYDLGGNLRGPSRLAFRNIRIHRDHAEGEHAWVDIYFNYWAGVLRGNTTWSGIVYVGGDVTIPDRVRLTLTPGTEVRFLANTDDTDSGDTDRSELIVQDGGTLEANAGNITFRSSNAPDDATRSDWYGIVVEDGGTADISHATVRDGVRCAQAPGTGTLTAENTVFRHCGLAPPGPPENLEATPGVGEVVLSWTAADSNGATILRYETQHSDDGGINWSGWAEVARGGAARRDTVEELTHGTEYTFEVRAINGEGTGAAVRDTATPTAQPPDAPGNLTPTAGDGQVALRWTPPDDHGSAITGYACRDSSHADGRWTAWTAIAPSDTTYTVEERINGTTYTFEVLAVNDAGEGEAASTTATPQFFIHESENASVEFAEIVEGTEEWDPLVATYTTNAAADTPVTWSLSGTDSTAFAITEGALSFQAAPDYETQPSYAVTVRAQVRAGTATASQDSVAVEVAVTNVEEEGSVSVSPLPPEVGQVLTATLEDEDGIVTGTTWWTWSAASAAGPWMAVSGAPPAAAVAASVPYPEVGEYTPTRSDVGRVLRVWVDYEDAFGPKEVVSDATEEVLPAGEVTLSPPQPRVGQPITATLSGPEAAVTGAAWSWWRRQQDTDEWELVPCALLEPGHERVRHSLQFLMLS